MYNGKKCFHLKILGYIAKKKTHISPQMQRLFWYKKYRILKILGIFCDWLSYAKIIRFGWSHVFIYIAYYRHFKNIIDLNLIATLTNPSLSRHKTYKILVKILTKFSLKTVKKRQKFFGYKLAKIDVFNVHLVIYMHKKTLSLHEKTSVL